jgi:hypothetical protein
MSYSLVVRLEIEEEVIDAAVWYESKNVGDGHRFFAAFDQLLDDILHRPLRYRVSVYGPRKGRVKGYPHDVYFTLAENVITIRAIVHVRSNPDWIQTRFF